MIGPDIFQLKIPYINIVAESLADNNHRIQPNYAVYEKDSRADKAQIPVNHRRDDLTITLR